MKLGTFASVALGAVALVSSFWFYTKNTANLKMRLEIYEAQGQVEQLQPQLVAVRQKLDAQREKLNTGSAIAEKIGPAVLNDIVNLAEKNNNTELKELLRKHGFEAAGAAK